MTKQMANFGNGQRKQWVAIRGHFKDHRGDQILGTDSGQKCMSEHAQRDVAIPSGPTSDLVVVESEVFGIFKVLLDMPACANSLHHLLQGGSFGGKDEVVGFFERIVHTAAHEQPMSPIIAPFDAREERLPNQRAWGLCCLDSSRGAANPERQARGLLRRGLPPVVVARQGSVSRRARRRGPLAHTGTAAPPARHAGPDCSHRRYQPRPRKWESGPARCVRASVGLVHTWCESEGNRERPPLDSAAGLLSKTAADRVRGSCQAVPRSGHIVQKHADLAVLGLPCGPTILHLDACRFLATFWKTGFINDENGGLLTEMFHHIGAQVVSDPIDVPDGTREQALHAIGRLLSGVLGQLPAIFALGATEDALQIGKRPTTRFWSGKASSDAGVHTC